MRWVGLVGLGVIVSAGLAFGTGMPDSRIEWEGNPTVLTVSFSPSSILEDTGAGLVETRAVRFSGRLLRLSRADTLLFSVYLDEIEDVPLLTEVLESAGNPSDWDLIDQDELLGEFLRRHAAVEELPIDPNGHLAIVADNDRLPGMNHLVVVNSAGEILGTRTLWESESP
jgi:hypothetical protein